MPATPSCRIQRPALGRARVQDTFDANRSLVTPRRSLRINCARLSDSLLHLHDQARVGSGEVVVRWTAAPANAPDEMAPNAAVPCTRPMTNADISAACVVLTRAFVGTPEQISMPNALRYTNELLHKTPRGILFVARLIPDNAAALPPNQDSRLVGTLALSLCPETRAQFATLQPPESAAYISNVAVDSSFRRQGIAALMMRLAEVVAREAHMQRVTLHVRQVDSAARELYSKLGYTELARDQDSLQLRLKGIRPRILLAKEL